MERWRAQIDTDLRDQQPCGEGSQSTLCIVHARSRQRVRNQMHAAILPQHRAAALSPCGVPETRERLQATSGTFCLAWLSTLRTACRAAPRTQHALLEICTSQYEWWRDHAQDEPRHQVGQHSAGVRASDQFASFRRIVRCLAISRGHLASRRPVGPGPSWAKGMAPGSPRPLTELHRPRRRLW